jgi:hypothetical protein
VQPCIRWQPEEAADKLTRGSSFMVRTYPRPPIGDYVSPKGVATNCQIKDVR